MEISKTLSRIKEIAAQENYIYECRNAIYNKLKTTFEDINLVTNIPFLIHEQQVDIFESKEPKKYIIIEEFDNLEEFINNYKGEQTILMYEGDSFKTLRECSVRERYELPKQLFYNF